MYYRLPCPKAYSSIKACYEEAGFLVTKDDDWSGYWGNFKKRSK